MPITANGMRKSSSRKSNATPIKMLIAQEMLKDSELKQQQQPSIVARLMGLDDAMPVQKPVLNVKGNLQESYPRSKPAGASRGRRQQGDLKVEPLTSHEIHPCSHEKEYKDVYAVYQQPSRTNLTTPKERLGANQDRKRMDLVRRKFTEAKRLATDKKLLHSQGKVSSFFSRNKKPVKQKIVPSQHVGSETRIQSRSPESVLKIRDDLSKSVCDSSHEEILVMNPEEPSSKASSPASGSDFSRMTAFSSKISMSPRTLVNNGKNQGKPGISENPITIQDQPSPTSILDALLEDDVQSTLSSSSEVANAGHFQASSRSAPIEPVACSLLWDDAQFEISPSKPSTVRREDEEEHTWFIYFQNLVSSVGLDNVRVEAVFTKWHSPESPLDPLSLYKILDQKVEGAKIREKSSSQRLLFDCVNTALLDVGHTALLDAYPWTSECGKVRKHAQSGALVAKEVWSVVKGWHSSHANQVTSIIRTAVW